MGDYGYLHATGYGKAWVYSGDTGVLLHDWSGILGAGLGARVAGLGDVNGNPTFQILVIQRLDAHGEWLL